jgi:hypothetical protein
MHRNGHEPATSWLPSTDDLLMAPERAILAALDASLQLAIRSLRAEYPGLDENGRLIEDPDWEPYVPPQVPLIEPLVRSAADLRRQIDRFRTTLDLVLDGDATTCAPPLPEEVGEDDDIPF